MIPLVVSDQIVELVSSSKLLGVTIDDSLRWHDRINSVTSKANKRLWFSEKT